MRSHRFRYRALVMAMLLLAAVWRCGRAIAQDADMPPEQGEVKLRFAVISDIHVEQWNPLSVSRLRQALLDLNAAAPDAEALILNGDLGNGRPEDYEALGRLMERGPRPERVFYTIGNHEFYKAWEDPTGRWNEEGFPNGDNDLDATGRFLTFTGYSKVYREVWLKEYHFLFLGSEAYRQSVPGLGEEAWLSDEQLGWLERSIRLKAERGRPVFVFLHQPLPGTVAGSGTEALVHPQAALRYKRLQGILAQYPQAVLFTGHTHRGLGLPSTFVRRGFAMVNTSSVYEPLREDDRPFGEEDVRSEGLLVEVCQDKVRIRGRNFARSVWVPEAEYEIGRVE